jgi:hypothetical protein
MQAMLHPLREEGAEMRGAARSSSRHIAARSLIAIHDLMSCLPPDNQGEEAPVCAIEEDDRAPGGGRSVQQPEQAQMGEQLL